MHDIGKIKDYWPTLFIPPFKFVSSEINVYGDLGMMVCDSMGRIDYQTKFSGRYWLIEEDMAMGDKWHWTKILAYRSAWCIDNPITSPTKVLPCVFLNDLYYNDSLRNVLSCLKCEFFFFKRAYENVVCTYASYPDLVIKSKRMFR